MKDRMDAVPMDISAWLQGGTEYIKKFMKDAFHLHRILTKSLHNDQVLVVMELLITAYNTRLKDCFAKAQDPPPEALLVKVRGDLLTYQVNLEQIGCTALPHCQCTADVLMLHLFFGAPR
eukprot:NODE_1886_length_538_cov_178.848193_g1872_i0.p1 GENE.NODE_1886_length_538_cov_178.848193_g1872_i0~~NODE_1886_length_538_cov_178.848193_g1872_i0.p1  ORF type:complete len:120 (-),score=1.63 NODE_1886_length_538_cov_178.848193_g1872_i0:73-432(-)